MYNLGAYRTYGWVVLGLGDGGGGGDGGGRGKVNLNLKAIYNG